MSSAQRIQGLSRWLGPFSLVDRMCCADFYRRPLLRLRKFAVMVDGSFSNMGTSGTMAKFNALAAAADLPDPKDQMVDPSPKITVSNARLTRPGAEQPGCLIKP
ncbi:hypothetical protein [Burkholderia vietnamiensis]|uniref:hypothetical protein n=2 Tax=Burkholderia vietnamiensis TaxID=60552 RepID=UPI0012D8C9B1|nr:hypothetical protein [Burkholderia vietnamiensis]